MLFFEDLSEGTTLWGDEVKADNEQMLAFAAEFDPQGFHLSREAAGAIGLPDVCASSGYIWALALRSMYAIASDLAFRPTPGSFQLAFPAPVYAGDRLRLRSEITELRKASKPGRGIAKHHDDLLKHDGQTVMTLDGVWFIATRDP